MLMVCAIDGSEHSQCEAEALEAFACQNLNIWCCCII